MRRNYMAWIIFLLLLTALALFLLPGTVGASDGLPEGVFVFEVGDHMCVLSENDLECFCPCGGCGVTPEPTVSPTGEKPVPSETPTDEPYKLCSEEIGLGKVYTEWIDTGVRFERTFTEQHVDAYNQEHWCFAIGGPEVKPYDPAPTPKPECKIWLCHKPGTAAEQDYCCYDSEGCKAAHLKHGDYLGKCTP